MDRRYLILPFLAIFAFFTLGPLAVIVAMSFARRGALGEIEPAFVLDAYITLFDPLYAKIGLLTLGFGLLTTLLTLPPAYLLALYVSRLKPGRRIWVLTLVLIPFWTSFVIRILAFMDVLRLRPFGMEWTYTPKGILATMVYNYLPLAVLPLYSAMEKIDNSLFEAARDLGASKRQIFLRVLWPLTSRATATAALFVFGPSICEFLIPDIVGGGHYFLLGNFLQNQFLTARNWPLGAAAIVIVILITLGLLAVAGWRKGALATAETTRV
jgi:spermidine/putrescine transport system permease protein